MSNGILDRRLSSVVIMGSLQPGTLIDDRYLITGILGTGGMGTVYAASEQLLKRNVAIKIIHQPVSNTEYSLARFKREANVLSHLQHKNLVGFYRYGIWQGKPYVVLENLAGPSLAKILSEGPLTPKQALAIALQNFE